MSVKHFAFEDFEVDTVKRHLFRQGGVVPLNSKTFDLLVAFLESGGEVLAKADLLNKVWPNQFVEESNLPVHISTLRKALNEKKDEHRFIVTVPGRGYRFVPPVSVENDVASSTETAHRGRILAIFAGILLIFLVGSAVFLSRTKVDVDRIATLSRLTTSGKVTAATISPNGRYVVFAQEEPGGQSLWLRQMADGSQTKIKPAEKVEFVGLSISPDGNAIYYSIFSANKVDEFVRRMPITGGSATDLPSLETGVSLSFSPQGDQIAYTKHSSSKGATYLVKAKTDGTDEVLLSTAYAKSRAFETFKSNPVAWAPSGEDIAAAVVSETEGVRRSGIELFNAENGGARELVPPKFAFIENLVWIDNNRLGFIANDNDEWSSQVYVVERSTGEIKKLTNDLQGYSWLSYSNGLLLTVQSNFKSSVNRAKINDSSPPPVSELVSESGTMWSAPAPDGSILYTSTTSGQREIWRISKDGGNPERLTTGAQVTYGLTVSSADGSIVFCSDREGPNSLWIADSNVQNIRRLTSEVDIAPQFSANGRMLTFQRGFGPTAAIWTLDREGGDAFQSTNKYSLKPTLSPDGSTAAYYFMDPEAGGEWRIGIVEARTERIIEKLSFPFAVPDRRMAWHPSGEFIGQAYSSNGAASLLIMPLNGEPPRLIEGLGEGRMISMSWLPNGDELVYSLMTETRDVITISNF